MTIVSNWLAHHPRTMYALCIAGCLIVAAMDLPR